MMNKTRFFSAVLRSLVFAAAVPLLFAATAYSDTIYRYEKTISLTTNGARYSETSPAPSNAGGARGMHFVDGLLYVAQNSARMVQVVDPSDGSVLRTISHTITGSSNLVDVWADSDGNVWAVNDVGTGAKLWFADSDDTELSEAFALTSTGRAFSVARDAAGIFYVADYDGPVAKYDATGTLLASASSCGSYAIDVNADGTLVYGGGGVTSSIKMPSKSVGTIDIAANTATSLNTFDNYADTTGVALAADGNIFTALRRTSAAGDNCVIKYDSAGNVLDKWNEWDPVTGELSFDNTNGGVNDNGMGAVYGVAVDDATGAVYVGRNPVFLNSESGFYEAQVMVFTAVPEPGVLAALAAGLVTLLVFSRRR